MADEETFNLAVTAKIKHTSKEKDRETYNLHPQRVAGRLCEIVSPHRSHAALHIQRVYVVEATRQ